MSELDDNRLPPQDAREGLATDIPETAQFVLNQTMLRIRDPRQSLDFYINVMGLSLVKQIDFPEMEFSLYFLGYIREHSGDVPGDPHQRASYALSQPAMLELTHNWGTENDDSFEGYHDGNKAPQGFGHIGMSVPDVDAACERFEKLGVEFVKRPNDGKMKGLAFIRDPDGYWIEILNGDVTANIARDLGRI